MCAFYVQPLPDDDLCRPRVSVCARPLSDFDPDAEGTDVHKAGRSTEELYLAIVKNDIAQVCPWRLEGRGAPEKMQLACGCSLA